MAELPQLSEHPHPLVRSLVQAARAETPPVALGPRTLQALGVSAAVAAAAGVSGHASAAVAPAALTSASKLTPLALVKWLGSGFVVGTLTLGAVEVTTRTWSAPTLPEGSVVAAPSSVARHPVLAGLGSARVDVAPERAAVPPQVGPVVKAPSSGAAALQPDAESPLARETRLIERARRAVRAGDVPGAVAALDEHALDFPAGELAAEAAYLRAETRRIMRGASPSAFRDPR